MARTGRNAPCPCGSGKKYKKCCLRRDEARARGAAAPGGGGGGAGDVGERAAAGGRLLNWARRPEWTHRWDEVIDEHTRKVLEVEGCDLEDLGEILGEDLVTTVLAFSLEDLATGRFDDAPENLVDDYLARRGWAESATGRRYLEALRDSTVSLYEVVGVEPGRSVRVRDMLRPETEYDVRERLASQGVVRWDVIAARVVPGDGVHLFTGASLPYERDAAEELVAMVARATKQGLAAIREELGELPGLAEATARGAPDARDVPDADDAPDARDAPAAGDAPDAPDADAAPLPEELARELLLANAAPMIATIWLADVLKRHARPAPRLVNFDGDEIVLTKVRFELAAEASEGVTARLDGCPELDRDPEDASTWRWNRPHRRGDPGGGDVVSLGRLELSGDRLVLECNSRERAERGRRLVEELLGELCRPGLTSMEGIEAAMERLGEEDAISDSLKPDVPHEELHALELRFKQEHYAGWLDEELPALDGETPRRAVRREPGRKKLVALLKDMERTELRAAARRGSTPYDFSWMWEELGLER